MKGDSTLINYELTKKSVAAFLDDILEDVLETEEYSPIEITIGSRTITADLFSEVYEVLEELLEINLKIIEEETQC